MLIFDRLFGIKCVQCACAFYENDLVMRAGPVVYHIECFRCDACGRHLATGDEYALRDGRLLCREDNEVAEEAAAAAANTAAASVSDIRNNSKDDDVNETTTSSNTNNNNSINNNNNDVKGD